MILLLFIAKPLPKALPPIVRAATIAAIVSPINNTFKWNSLAITTAIVVAAVPEIIPHTSPTTSQQKLDTLEAFFLNLTATSAPFSFL